MLPINERLRILKDFVNNEDNSNKTGGLYRVESAPIIAAISNGATLVTKVHTGHEGIEATKNIPVINMYRMYSHTDHNYFRKRAIVSTTWGMKKTGTLQIDSEAMVRRCTTTSPALFSVSCAGCNASGVYVPSPACPACNGSGSNNVGGHCYFCAGIGNHAKYLGLQKTRGVCCVNCRGFGNVFNGMLFVAANFATEQPNHITYLPPTVVSFLGKRLLDGKTIHVLEIPVDVCSGLGFAIAEENVCMFVTVESPTSFYGDVPNPNNQLPKPFKMGPPST